MWGGNSPVALCERSPIAYRLMPQWRAVVVMTLAACVFMSARGDIGIGCDAPLTARCSAKGSTLGMLRAGLGRVMASPRCLLGDGIFYGDNWINTQYYWGMDELPPTQWIAACAERLHARWHTLDQVQLEEVAVDLWRDIHWRSMPPSEAAATWLEPVSSGLDATAAR